MKLHLQTTIWTLLKAGSTQRQIERATGISRHTIRAYKKKFDSQSPDSSADQASAPIQTAPPWPPTPSPEQVTSASICEPYRDYVEAQLRLKLLTPPLKRLTYLSCFKLKHSIDCGLCVVCAVLGHLLRHEI